MTARAVFTLRIAFMFLATTFDIYIKLKLERTIDQIHFRLLVLFHKIHKSDKLKW